MKLLVSAAEISSDIQAEACLRSLIQKLTESGETVEIVGIGGPRVRSLPNFKCLEQAEKLKVMGFTEVVGKIPFIKKTQDRLVAFAKNYKPDVYITFDFPDFHLRLTERLYQLPEMRNTLKICAIPPKIWAWRKGRVKKIKRIYDGVLVVLPFEKQFYEQNGVPVIYEGNPLAAQLPFGLSQKDAQERLGCTQLINESYFPISVFPGSRDGELKRHLPLIVPALEKTAKKINQKILALVPVAPGSNTVKIKSALTNSAQVHYLVFEGQSAECLKASSVGLIKSGTSTLEAVLLGVFPVIFYKISWISSWIFRLIVRYSGPVGLPNVLLGIKKRSDSVFPELLGPDAEPEKLSDALANLIKAKDAADSIQNEKSKELKLALVPSQNVPGKIAEAIHQWIKDKPAAVIRPEPRIKIKIVSTIWSCINFLRRRLKEVFPPPMLPLSPSVLIGNLQAGGTGKTPILKALALDAIEKGKSVAILTRGYGGTVKEPILILPKDAPVEATLFGDEVAELQRSLPDAVFGVGPDRMLAAKLIKKWAAETGTKVDLTLLDDGFQNLKFKTDYTLLCVTDLTSCEAVYRDFECEAKDVDLIIGTKGNASGESFLRWQKLSVPFFKIDWIPEQLPKLPVYLLCAVGSPEEVQRYYQKLGVKVVGHTFLPDHSSFTQIQVQELLDAAAALGAMLAVTEKDFVKLKDIGFQEYTDNYLTLAAPDPTKIAVLRRNANVKELFKRILRR